MSRNRNLDYWKEWVKRNEAAYQDEVDRMDRREALYQGDVREIEPLTDRDTMLNGDKRMTSHLRNIISENIESEVSSTIPQPKVTARRKEDERRAKILEDMLRNELDRLPMEELNDQAERMIPKQGGAFWLVEWDNSKRTHSTVGDVVVTLVHPKEVVPQDGVFTRVEDMDAFALKLPQTKATIKRMYGKDIRDEGEENPEVRTLDENASAADDLVTQYTVYYRNNSGGVGKISWVNDVLLEDMEDYQARRLRRCENCGNISTDPNEKTCPKCGGAIHEQQEESETLTAQVDTDLGTSIPDASPMIDSAGYMITDPIGRVVMGPTKLPYYKPDTFPVFLQRNVSLFGRLLGDSDVDKIADQQNTVNRIETKIIDRFIKAGTRITLPDRADFKVDPEDGEKWYVGNPADLSLIKSIDFSGDLSQEMAYLAQVYEEARQILGITDSFQGRRDTTAQSGVAKQFAAAQSAGRLESKRVLKEAAYAELFKRIVQLKVAYADEPRPIVATDDRAGAQYEEFNRYDFYERDAQGKWHCILDDDRFLFSCDTSTPLANNREQMWQDAANMFQMGAFGQPGSIDSLMLYWTKLELLHYPGASDTKELIDSLQQQQQQMQMMQMQMQREIEMAKIQSQERMAAAARDAEVRSANWQAEREVEGQAKEDAWRSAKEMQAMKNQAAPPMSAPTM